MNWFHAVTRPGLVAAVALLGCAASTEQRASTVAQQPAPQARRPATSETTGYQPQSSGEQRVPVAGYERAAAQQPAEQPVESPAQETTEGAADEADETHSGSGSLAEQYADADPVEVFRGTVSYYGRHFAGKRTASGETYDPEDLSAASPRLPFDTVVRVVNPENGRSVVVRINDRGPHTKQPRVLDLSRAAAEQLGFVEEGLLRSARVEVLHKPDRTGADPSR